MEQFTYDVGIGYGDDIEAAKRLILEAIHGTDGILENPAPDVIVVELGRSRSTLCVGWPAGKGKVPQSHSISNLLKRLTEIKSQRNGTEVGNANYPLATEDS